MRKKEYDIHKSIHKRATNLSKKELITSIVWVFLILLVFYISIKLIGTDNLEEKVAAAGIFGPLILIIVKASTIVFAPLGGLPLYILSGTLFGFFKGTLYVVIGDFLGFTISFYISRIFGKKIVKHFMSKQGMEAVSDVLMHMETRKGLMQCCLVFIGLPEAVSYGAGLSKISYTKLITTLMPIWLIPTILLVGLGRTVIKSISGSTLVIINLLVFIIIVIGLLWLHNKSKKNKEKITISTA